MLQGWDRQAPGRVENIARSLRHVVPSHLGDGDLFDFVSLATNDPSAILSLKDITHDATAE